MTREERIIFLEGFVKTEEWRKIREAILVKLDAPYWMIDEDERYLSLIEQNRSYCQLIKNARGGKECCKEMFNKGLEQMREKRGPVITRCRAGLLGFVSPLILEDKVIGSIGGCQIVDHDMPLEAYRKVTEEFGLRYNEFISYLNKQEALSRKLLEAEVDLIYLLCQSSIETVIQAERVKERDILLDNLIQFYKLLEEKKKLLFEVEPEELYQMIVDIVAESINCELCSLMLINPKTNRLNIKAAIGLPDEVVKKAEAKADEGVVGWVVMHGEPILLKDITQDPRFRPAHPERYYNNSLISTPIKSGKKVIGVLNANNEATRRIFNEGDLKLLSIIAENASVAIEGSMVYKDKKHMEWIATRTLEERQEALRLQTERMKAKIERRLKEEAEDKKRLEEESERLRIAAEEVDQLRAKAEQLQREALMARESAERERLKAEAARLQVEAEDVEHKKEADLLRRQIEDLKARVENLQSEEEKLKAEIEEAEELLTQAEKAGELEEEIVRLKMQIEQMKQEETRLRLKIEEAERLRARAEEAEKLRAETEELVTLYELSKEIISIPDPKEIPPWTLGKIQHLLNYDLYAYILFEEGEIKNEIVPLKPVSEKFIDGFTTQMTENWKALLRMKKEAPLRLKPEVDPKMVRRDGGIERLEFQFTPLIDRNSPTGIIYVGYLPKNASCELAKRILPIVGAHASVALEKLRIYLETRDLVDKDELTGIYNFRYFGKQFTDIFKISTRHQRPFSLLMIDFDYLKRFNDTFGHEEGNRLIKTIAELIKKNIRNEDILARFGGDEFVVILPETPGERAWEVAGRIMDVIRSHKHHVQGKIYSITASIGLASYPTLKTKNARDFFLRTDEALYQAKERGRNQVYAYGIK